MRLVISGQLVLKYCSIASPPNLKGELTADARSRNSHKDGFPAVLFRKILLSKGSDISLQPFLTLLLAHGQFLCSPSDWTSVRGSKFPKLPIPTVSSFLILFLFPIRKTLRDFQKPTF